MNTTTSPASQPQALIKLIEDLRRYQTGDEYPATDDAMERAAEMLAALAARPATAAAGVPSDDGKCRSCVKEKCVTGPECVTLGRDDAHQDFAFLAITATGERAHFGVEATAKAWAGKQGVVSKVARLVLASERDEWVDANFALAPQTATQPASEAACGPQIVSLSDPDNCWNKKDSK